MITTQVFPCLLAKGTADTLNRESGRIYTATMVEHYRVYRHTGHWVSPRGDQRLSDSVTGETILHAHSRDAAQEAFPKACKTARSCKKAGLDAHFPHRIKHWRTTIWKSSGIRMREGTLLLALARGHDPIRVAMPQHLRMLPTTAFLEMRLVWERAARRYFWHLVVEDGQVPSDPTHAETAGIDLGEIHPVSASDGRESVIFSARQLRSLAQYGSKRLAELQQRQSKKVKGSKRWKRIQQRKNRFLAQ